MHKKPGASKTYRCICCVCEAVLNITPAKLKRLDPGFFGKEESFTGPCPRCKARLVVWVHPDPSGQYMVSEKIGNLWKLTRHL